uniref:Uncharacterized protein n=1 Tax=Opuntia streptacantha TaxID=393608 RepID=A0A7C9E1Y0_OPUST
MFEEGMANLLTDFEMDDSLLAPPPVSTNKRRKMIGLDDLFNEHKMEQERGKKRKSNGARARKVYASDNDDDTNETEHRLTETLLDFRKTIKEVDGQDDALNELDREDVNVSWGLQVFGTQRAPLPLAVPDLGGCMLLQSFGSNELSMVMAYNSDMEKFLKGLLLNGWLSKLIMNCRFLEESIAKWTFNLLVYSSDESLMTSACEFWCAILLCSKADEHALKIGWLPGFLEMNRALESFGMLSHFLPGVGLSDGIEESDHMDSACRGPPINVRVWIKFLNACCQLGNRCPVFSAVEAEKIVGSLVCLFLERQLLGLTMALHDCLISVISSFEEKEWNNSCENVAKSLADRVPRDPNCLRMIECISGVDARSKQLRSTVASDILRSCFDEEMTDTEDVLKSLISINLKVRSCDLFKIYIYLVLIENCLIFGGKANPVVNELWRGFIWKCSSQIPNTDFRPCAQEIRSRAAYLLQSTTK